MSDTDKVTRAIFAALGELQIVANAMPWDGTSYACASEIASVNESLRRLLAKAKLVLDRR